MPGRGTVATGPARHTQYGPGLRVTPPYFPTATLGLLQRAGDLMELAIGIGPDRGNGRQADDHNQRAHNCVFDRGGSVFRDKKAAQADESV